MTVINSTIRSYLSQLYGETSAEKFINFIKDEPTQYLRVNFLKTTRQEVKDILKNKYDTLAEDIPGIPFALKITSGKELVSKTIEHINGLYYMQGLSSMIPPIVLKPEEENVILDLCSAPGSKTTEIGEMMNNSGTLAANEIALNRVKMLAYNIDRMNLVNTGVLHHKGELLSKVYSDYFDKILVDAPCSGLGIMQKKDEVNDWWTLEKAEMLGDIQLRLLIAAIKMVKMGGEIIYSTCTLTPEENEFVIDKILKKYPVELAEVELPVPSIEGFTSYNGVSINPQLSKSRRILPWEADSDGFFITKLIKIGETEPPDSAPLSGRAIRLLPYSHKDIRKNIINITTDFDIDESILESYNYILKGNDIFFVVREWEDNDPGIFERIGTKFGQIDKHGKTVLHTQAAQVLEKHISKSIFVIEEQNDLKQYLDGGIIKKDPGFKGQCVIKYDNHILGSAVVTGQGIKSRFPRAKRTQEIMKDF